MVVSLAMKGQLANRESFKREDTALKYRFDEKSYPSNLFLTMGAVTKAV